MNRDITRNAIVIVSGVLSGGQLRRLAQAAEKVEHANAHLGTRSQAEANHGWITECYRIADELGDFNQGEVAKRIKRQVHHESN